MLEDALGQSDLVPVFDDEVGRWQQAAVRGVERDLRPQGHECAIIAFAWTGPRGRGWLVAVNYADHRSQCCVPLSLGGMSGGRWRLQDRQGDAVYDREGDDLATRELYLDMAPRGCRAFEVDPVRVRPAHRASASGGATRLLMTDAL